MRVLDEVAVAINLARAEPTPRPVVAAFGLEDQFTYTLHPHGWAALQRHLGCPFRRLSSCKGTGSFRTASRPSGTWWKSRPPEARTVAAWRSAQVFAGVRDVMVDALNVEPVQVTRKTRFKDIAD